MIFFAGRDGGVFNEGACRSELPPTRLPAQRNPTSITKQKLSVSAAPLGFNISERCSACWPDPGEPPLLLAAGELSASEVLAAFRPEVGVSILIGLAFFERFSAPFEGVSDFARLRGL